jgi:hypothetical protein
MRSPPGRRSLMTRCALLAAVFTLVAADKALAQDQGASCPFHTQAGVILKIAPIPGRPSMVQGDMPQVTGLSLPRRAASGVALCTADRVSNPKGSTEIVQYRFTGQRPQDLAPGNAVQVPPPTWSSRFVDVLAEIDPNFGPDRAEHGNGTRGNEHWRAIWPLPPRLEVAPTLGALVLAWPDGTVGTVTVATGSSSVTEPITNPMKLDIVKSCPRGCTLTISTKEGVSRSAEIHIAELSEVPTAPQLSALKRLNPAARVVEGAWLSDVQSEPSWRLQGASVLWSAACAYPFLDFGVAALYRLASPPDYCADIATF